jgi:hypothetical protein
MLGSGGIHYLKMAIFLIAVCFLASPNAARADRSFRVMEGIAASPLTSAEMDSIRGDGIFNRFDPFTSRIETCVLGGLSCSGQATFTDGSRGFTPNSFNPNLFNIYSVFTPAYQPVFTGFGVASLLSSWGSSFFSR